MAGPLMFAPGQEDEDELMDSSAPYDSISDRPTLDASDNGSSDLSMASSIGAAAPSVKDYIAAKKGLSLNKPAAPDYSNDPMLKDFDQKQQELNKFRADQANTQADQIKAIALGQIAQQAARGANAPGSGDEVAKTLQALSSSQNAQALKGREEDLDRRQKILNAIEQRASRENVASENRLMRQAILQGTQNQRDKTRGVQVNRLLGQTEKELRDDPLAKPAELNMASLQKSNMTLNNKNLPLTPNVLADAEADIANALQLRGQGATEGKIDRTKLLDLQRTFAELKQKWGTKNVDLRTEAPEIVSQIQNMNKALIDDYKTTIAQRKHSILDDREAIWGDDPAFANKLQALRSSITKRFGPAPSANASQPAGEPGGGLINSANAAGSKVVRKQYSPSRNQTKVTYDDGSEVLLDGKQ